jgi:hypothetical protein
MKKLITLLILHLSILACFAQVGQGALKMTITEKDNGLPIPFANVVLKDTNGHMITGGQSDFDGKIDIRPIPAGTYDVEVSYVGFKPVIIKKVIIQANATITLLPTHASLDKIDFEFAGINPDTIWFVSNLGSNCHEYSSGPNCVAVSTGSESINIRTCRGDAYYYIDGIRVRDAKTLIQNRCLPIVSEVGGLPAMFENGIDPNKKLLY